MKHDISKLHLDILDKNLKSVLNRLDPYFSTFTLSGGTALALQIKHRQSFDIDLFSPHEIAGNIASSLREIMQIEKVMVDSSDELTILTKNHVKVSFISYPFNGKFDVLSSSNIKFYTVESIAVQKAYTIGRRGAYRDYFDLYSLFSIGVITLPKLLNKARSIYGSLFNDKLFLEQLTYFGDLKSFEIIPVRAEDPIPAPEEVKDFFEKMVKKYLSKN